MPPWEGPGHSDLMDTQPTPSAPSAPMIHPAVRIIIGLVAAGAAGFGALVAWLIGIITFTGCFISCGTPEPLAGSALMILTAGLVGVVVVSLDYAIRGWKQRRSLRVLAYGSALGAVLGILSLLAS
jgi:hypothetical protein